MNRVLVMRQVEVADAEFVDRVLTQDVLDALRLVIPPPVVFVPMHDRWSGYCNTLDVTAAGEIVIDDYYSDVQPGMRLEKQRRDLLRIYLHEIAHRFTQGFTSLSHGAVFAAVNFALLLRVRSLYPEAPQWMRFYDFWDHVHHAEQADMPQALRFVLDQGLELAESTLPAEQLGVAAFAAWQQYVHRLNVEEPAEREKQKQLDKAKDEKITTLTKQVAAWQSRRSELLGWGFLLGQALSALSVVSFLLLR